MSPQPEPETQNETIPAQFLFERYVVRRVSFQEVERQKPAEGETRPHSVGMGITIGGAIQMNPAALRAIITLDVTLEADPRWQPYRIQIEVSGGFSGQNVTFEQFDAFCRNGVPVILFPYVREIAYTVSRDGLYGPIKVDPINIGELASKAEWGEPHDPNASIELEPPI
jgi:preprotein translocase subunit SecB